MLSNRRSTMMVPPMNMTNRPKSYGPATMPATVNGSSLNPESEPHCTAPSILSSTMPDLPGYRTVKVLGAVYGSTTYVYKDTKSLLRSLGVGAEAKSLTHMMYNAREQAVERMTRDCVTRGANAVVGMSFEESEVMGFAQVSVYGTAVCVEKVKPVENPFLGS